MFASPGLDGLYKFHHAGVRCLTISRNFLVLLVRKNEAKVIVNSLAVIGTMIMLKTLVGLLVLMHLMASLVGRKLTVCFGVPSEPTRSYQADYTIVAWSMGSGRH